MRLIKIDPGVEINGTNKKKKSEKSKSKRNLKEKREMRNETKAITATVKDRHGRFD